MTSHWDLCTADKTSSFGDMIALSRQVDAVTAKIISREVSDGVCSRVNLVLFQFLHIPLDHRSLIRSPCARYIKGEERRYEQIDSRTLCLANHLLGKYLILQMDGEFSPASQETRTVYGVTLTQQRNHVRILPEESFTIVIVPKESPRIPDSALRDLTVATITLKYTQSNSVCYALNGQVIGLGAGQQSRIHCTRLAGDKAENWWMRFHERTLGLKWKEGIKRPDKR